MQQAQVSLWGPFRIRDKSGIDRTPRGTKERALLAMLLLSPNQHRRRQWLQDKLWSKSSPAAGQTSFRRALANIRRDLGPLSSLLKSDRSAIWFDPQQQLPSPEKLPETDFLSDLDIDDDEFETWLRDERRALAHDEEHLPSQSKTVISENLQPVISILKLESQNSAARFISNMLAQELATHVQAIGSAKLLLDPATDGDNADYCFVIETMAEDDECYILLRLMGRPSNNCLWSQRLHERPGIGPVWKSAALIRLINRGISALSDQFSIRGPNSDFARLQRAVLRIYNYDRPGLETAAELLRSAARGDAKGLALAWLAFARLTMALEFRETSSTDIKAAIEMADEAVRLAPNMPTVLALAAQVQLKLVGDMAFGHHLALRAIDADEANPHALDALSQSQMLRGEYQLGQRTAEQAQQMANGLFNSFSWDMQAALGALGLERLSDAEQMLRVCHGKMPGYRPALRYLVALNLLLDNPPDVERFADRLRRIEPDFNPESLLKDNYPVHTLQRLGLRSDIKAKID